MLSILFLFEGAIASISSLLCFSNYGKSHYLLYLYTRSDFNDNEK